MTHNGELIFNGFDDFSSDFFLVKPFSHICKREPNYKNALRYLRSNALIQLVRSKDPHRITKDGIRAGRIMLLCKDLGLL